MLEYDTCLKDTSHKWRRIDISEGIDVNKTSASKECDICHYWYFWNKGFTFQLNVCNRCHDLLMVSMNLSNIAISNIKGSEYCLLLEELVQMRP